MVKAVRPEVLEKIVATIPTKRLGTPEEIASIVAWIASDDAGFATGADFSLNGELAHGIASVAIPAFAEVRLSAQSVCCRERPAADSAAQNES